MCCPPARRWRTTARSLTSDLFRSGSRHRCRAAALPCGRAFLSSAAGSGKLLFSVEKTGSFQHFPRTFQHPSRKTPKRNVEKQVFCGKIPWKTRGKGWKSHFCGENLLNSTAFSRFFSEPPQSDKRSVLYDQKAKKEPAADPDRAGPCDPAQAAAPCAAGTSHPGGAAALPHPVLCGGQGRAAQGHQGRQEPPAL